MSEKNHDFPNPFSFSLTQYNDDLSSPARSYAMGRIMDEIQ